MSRRTMTMAICMAYLRASRATPPLFAADEIGLASATEFMGPSPLLGCGAVVGVEAARPGDMRQHLDEPVEADLVLHELGGDSAAVEDDDAVGDGVNVEDVVIDEDGRLARSFD